MDTRRGTSGFLKFFYVQGSLTLKCITQMRIQMTSDVLDKGSLDLKSWRIPSLGSTRPQEPRGFWHRLSLFVFVHQPYQLLLLSEWRRNEIGRMSPMTVLDSRVYLLSQSKQKDLLVEIYFSAEWMFTFCLLCEICIYFLLREEEVAVHFCLEKKRETER